jgi:hypothetical protein
MRQLPNLYPLPEGEGWSEGGHQDLLQRMENHPVPDCINFDDQGFFVTGDPASFSAIKNRATIKDFNDNDPGVIARFSRISRMD